MSHNITPGNKYPANSLCLTKFHFHQWPTTIFWPIYLCQNFTSYQFLKRFENIRNQLFYRFFVSIKTLLKPYTLFVSCHFVAMNCLNYILIHFARYIISMIRGTIIWFLLYHIPCEGCHFMEKA